MRRQRILELFLAGGSVAMGATVAFMAYIGLVGLSLIFLGLATAGVVGWVIGRKLGLSLLEKKLDRLARPPEIRSERWDEWWKVRVLKKTLRDETGGERGG